MRRKRLGSEGPELSVVGYGAWEAGGMAWGSNPPDEQTIDAMRVGIDAGINWIDTAEVYGAGHSERLVAKAIEGYDDVYVFTKVAPRPAGTGFEPKNIREAAEASRERLGRERIDLFQLHRPDRAIEVEETWEAMAQLVEDGLVRWIGVSNFNAELLERCERVRHVDSLQPHFSLLWQERRTMFPTCERNGTGVLAYGPLGFGLLTGGITHETVFGDDDWRGGKHGMSAYPKLFEPGKLERNLEIVERLRPIADRVGCTLAQLALAWVAAQAGVTGAIAGSRNPTHVSENAGAGSVDLSKKDLDEIDAVVAERS
jgi:aryl-alcohol dehydrogenase-like predicted oxidoreductase